MQELAEEFREGHDDGGAIGATQLPAELLLVHTRPAIEDRGLHTERLHGFRVAEGRERVARRHLAHALGGLLRLASQQLVGERTNEQHRDADERHQAEVGVQQEAHADEDGRERGVTKREQARAGPELADGIHVAQHLRRIVAAMLEGVLQCRAEERRAQGFVESHACADERAGAHPVQHRIDADPEGGDRGQRDKRRLIATDQHAVIDLQHVEGADELQQVRENGKDNRGPERRTVVGIGDVERRFHQAVP